MQWNKNIKLNQERINGCKLKMDEKNPCSILLHIAAVPRGSNGLSFWRLKTRRHTGIIFYTYEYYIKPYIHSIQISDYTVVLSG